MEYDSDAGLFLTLKDCTILFPKLKQNESSLSREERMIMLRIEKVLYGNLSIREMEELLDQAAGQGGGSDSGGPGSPGMGD